MSGTTGNPKGVAYHYCGACPNAVVEIEDVFYKHPVVLIAAVVAMPDPE